MHLPAAGARDGDRVHVGAVRVGNLCPGPFLEIGDGADDGVTVAPVAVPDGDGDTPVALPGDAPVTGLLDEIVEPGASRPLGVPLYLRDLLKHRVAYAGDLQEPLCRRPVDDGGLAPPAVAVTVSDRPPGEEIAAERVDDDVVCVPDVHVRKCPGRRGETPAGVDRAEGLKPFADADQVVVPSVPGGDMDEAGVLERDIVGRHDPVPDLRLVRHVPGERGRVLHPDQVAPAQSFEDGEVLVPAHLQDGLDEFIGDPEDLFAAVFLRPHPRVGERGVDRHRNVRRERPGCRRPDHQEFILAPDDRELDEDGGVGLVPVLHLRIGDRRLAPGAPVHDPVAAFEEPTLVGPLDSPPRGLDVARINGLVGVVEVEPDAELPELVAHDLHVRHRKRPALLDECGDAVLLDILLGGEPELVLHLHLDGETVHVVPGPLDDVRTPHPVIPEDGIFYDLVPGGAEMDVARGIRRPVDEKECFSILPQVLDACIGIFPLPVILDSRLDLARVITAGDFFHRKSLIFTLSCTVCSRGTKRFVRHSDRDDFPVGEGVRALKVQVME